jgi:hypothetical protein
MLPDENSSEGGLANPETSYGNNSPEKQELDLLNQKDFELTVDQPNILDDQQAKAIAQQATQLKH